MRKKHLQKLVFSLSIVLACAGFLGLLILLFPQPACMGVKIASADTIAKLTADRQKVDSIDSPILLDNAAVAADKNHQTIYIPQAITETAAPNDLAGKLSAQTGYNLCFQKDPAFDDLSKAVAENHAFTLLVFNDDTYASYRVVFTPLPVLSVNSSDSYTDEEETQVFTGSFTAFQATKNAADCAVQSSFAEWHIRGNTSVMEDKKAWKLSLKDGTGNKQNLPLAGLGSDDDWILNPMARDDLKIRERFIGGLWNQLTANENTAMSQGEYVELIMDGRYMGLYLLQRRVDRKYLSLNEKDILMKGRNYNNSPSVENALEVIHSPTDEQDAYAVAGPYFADYAPESIDLANYMDYELLINLCYLPDNIKLKNTFYLWQPNGANHTLSFIPWDTDMSLGFDYKEGIMFNIYLLSEAEILHRREYDALSALYPDLDRQIALRWQELRKSLISYEKLTKEITSLRADLEQSGALLRDYDRWEYYALGADTEQLLFGFLKGRIEQLDAYYQSILDEQ